MLNFSVFFCINHLCPFSVFPKDFRAFSHNLRNSEKYMMMPLNGDLISQILARVDSITLANAACVSSNFCSIASQENIWEEECCSLWSSIGDKDVKELISSSLGGFRKFYANCFPFIVYDESSERDSISNCNELKKLHDDKLALNTGVPSDFLWAVDAQYKNEVIFSKVVWGIPFAEKFPRWFLESPFRIDIINVEEEDTNEDGLPTVMSVDKAESKDGKFWRQLMDNIKLSWIVINRRTGQAANLSSWSPLAGQRRSASGMNISMRFGSILPAHNILPCKFVQCIIEMKFEVSETDHANLKIIELSMQLEDMMGDDVNGRNSLFILERALGCSRRKDRTKILESHGKYLREQSKFREANIRSEGSPNAVCIISGIVAGISLCYIILRESVILKNP